MLGRMGLTVRKAVWVTLRLGSWTWLVSLPLLVPAAVAAAIFKYTPVPWVGGNLFMTTFFAVTLIIAIKLTWPVWPTDEDMNDLPLLGSSGSATRSTGTPTNQRTAQNDPVDPDDPMEGMHMGGETELAAHEPWETVEQSPHNDPADAPNGLDTADDDHGW